MCACVCLREREREHLFVHVGVEESELFCPGVERKPLFKPQLLSHKCLLLWECCGFGITGQEHSLTLTETEMKEGGEESRWRERRMGEIQLQRQHENKKQKDKETESICIQKILGKFKGRDTGRHAKRKTERVKTEVIPVIFFL